MVENLTEYKASTDFSSEARYYQLPIEEALNLNVIDLFKDNHNDKRLISRADIILIYTLYNNDLNDFLEQYKSHVLILNKDRGYKFVPKPHYYLKDILG